MILALLLAASFTPIEDDYDGALEAARKKQQPLLVELWAPWCHTCASMRHYVLRDDSLEPLRDLVVFVALDTEQPKNEKAVAKLAPSVWPTFVVIDSKREHVLARLPGSATAQEFLRFVRSAVAPEDKAAASELARAEALQSSGKREAALAAYQKLAQDPARDASTRGRAALSAALLLMAKGDAGPCSSVGAKLADSARGTYYEPGIWAIVASCALELESPPEAVLRTAAAHLESAVASSNLSLSVDDKSDLYEALFDIRAHEKDESAATRVRAARLAMLERAAKDAPSSLAAQTFDAHRAELYIALGRFDDALAMLTASESSAPRDYNPPARRARVHLARKDLRAARAAVERAKARVYGPRTASILVLDAEIAAAAGDKAAARAAYSNAKKILSAMQPSLGVQRRLQQIDKALAAL